MATRAILTHQPEVECDVCGRRLLRGERPDTFLASGHSRTVCELCVPRATHVGWMRASDAQAAGSPATRGRPGRSLIGRLRNRRGQIEDHDEQEPELETGSTGQRRRRRSGNGGLYDREWTGGQPFHLEDDDEHLYSGAYAGAVEGATGEPGNPPRDEAVDAFAAEAAAEPSQPEGSIGGLAGQASADSPRADSARAVAALESPEVVAALESFNVSECATRIAGIARALGEPSVNVRQLDGSKVAITIAWELCWYRYEVDLRSDPVTISVIAEGMELDELPDEDRVCNASANERGELSLLG